MSCLSTRTTPGPWTSESRRVDVRPTMLLEQSGREGGSWQPPSALAGSRPWEFPAAGDEPWVLCPPPPPPPPRLIDGTNVTMEDEHMWLIPFSPREDHIVTIHFAQAEAVVGLRIWNYNKSPEDTYRGVSGGSWAAGPLSLLPPGAEAVPWPSSSPSPLLLCPGEGGPCVPGRLPHLAPRGLPHPQGAWQLPLRLCAGNPLCGLREGAPGHTSPGVVSGPGRGLRCTSQVLRRGGRNALPRGG